MNLAFVKIDFAASYLGRSVLRMFNLAEGGEGQDAGLLFVFNLANKLDGQRRDLRFYFPELTARVEKQPDFYRQNDINRVITQILPNGRRRYGAGQVDCMMQIRPRTRIDFGSDLPGIKIDGAFVYRREDLERFLRQRWLGAAVERALAA